MSRLALAQSPSPFDPAVYLNAKVDRQTDLKEAEVKIKGNRYRVFKSAAGAIYVPALDGVSKESVERGLCANQVPELLEKCLPGDKACDDRNQERMTTEVTLTRAETALSEHTKAYAEILTRTIKQKCGYSSRPYFIPMKMKPEVGVEYKDSQQRDPATYKVYTPGYKPELGFKSEF